MVMREAVQSGFASVNPCERLGIRFDVPAKKPRISEREHIAITEALAKEPEWMRVSYEIAWHQGCRFSETHLKIATQVDISNGVIRFRTKGHKETLAEFPLAAKLVPMFARMIAQGREWSYAMPAGAPQRWFAFFHKIGLPHLCFHCLRVTFITRCYEAGLAKESVMRLVGHASSTVHEIYPRLSATSVQIREMRSRI